MQVKYVYFPEKWKVACTVRDEDLQVWPKDIAVQTQYSIISAGTELAKLTGPITRREGYEDRFWNLWDA